MKIGKAEGSPEEIKDFFQANSLNIIDYLEKPEQPLKPVWFIVPVCLIISALVLLMLLTSLQTPVRSLVSLLGCSAGFWLAVNVQIRFKNTVATVFTAVGAVLIILVGSGTITPIGMVEYLSKLKK